MFLKPKTNIKLAKEFYETFERLKYNEDFIVFKEKVVDPELIRLKDKILSSADLNSEEKQRELATDVMLYQKLDTMFNLFFNVAEDQAKHVRKIIGRRERANKNKDKSKKA